MRKRSKKQTKSTRKVSSEDDQMNLQIVQNKRANNKAKKLKAATTEMSQHSADQIIDIKRGDDFLRQHYRPKFLRQWDQESNQFNLSDQEIQDMSPMLQVYWKKKCKNMNCILFVQFGKMQFLAFQNDAIKLHDLYKKPLKKFSKFLMVNFWYKEIQLIKLDLFERNIPIMMLNQVDDPQYRQQNKIIRRQITQVITPSLYLSIEPKNHRQRLLLCIYHQQNYYGLVTLDSQSNRFYIDQIDNDENYHQIRRIINRYRPVQIILAKGAENKQIKSISKHICNPFTLEIQYQQKNILDYLKQFEEINLSIFFKQIKMLFNKENPQVQKNFSLYYAIKSLGLLLQYLKNFDLEAKIFGQGLFEILCLKDAKIKPMFDAQVYQNLQVFRIRNDDDGDGKPGTLLAYVDKCNTDTGKKLLKRWLDQPLRSINTIKSRQQAIHNILDKYQQCLNLHTKLISYQKLQKNITDIYHWVIKNSQLGKLKLTLNINFDKDYNQDKNPAVTKLKQIYKIINLLKKLQNLFNQFNKLNFNSQLLLNILNIKQVDINIIRNSNINKILQLNYLPSINQLTHILLKKINYNQNNNYLQPLDGQNQIFDFQKNQIKKLNQQLQCQLMYWKKQLKIQKISYVSVRARNQLQIPKGSLKGKKYKQLIFSSETSNYQRYTTTKTNLISQVLMQHQQELAKAYQPFMNAIIIQFCSHKYIWDLYVRNLAQIDVLISLAKVASSMPIKCLPQFHKNGIYIKNGVHVGLTQVCQNVIPNTLQISGDQRVILLTGPNMGGKSTLLRQTCLLAILAQMGSYVPAESYHSIIFDQIFCRVGASDRILEGKSTFYVQLQQTERILSQATPDSLVIIDQLGRGTSTYDGMAIAQSTLRYLIEQVGAYVLFSTHYTPITESFLDCPQVQCLKIGYVVNQQSLKFTYQLQNGIAQKSFANNVAKIVGINQQILEIANRKSQELQINKDNIDDNNFIKLKKQFGFFNI